MSDAVNNSSSDTENLEVNNKSPLWNYVTILVAAKKVLEEIVPSSAVSIIPIIMDHSSESDVIY